MLTPRSKAPLKYAATIFPRLLLHCYDMIKFCQRGTQRLLTQYRSSCFKRLDDQLVVYMWRCSNMNKVWLLFFQHFRYIRIEIWNIIFLTKLFYSLMNNIYRCNNFYLIF